MSRPSKEQMDAALAAAEDIRDHEEDVHHLARTLLYLHRRNEVLELVYDAAKHYLNSGHDQHAHAKLIKAVEAARHQAHEDSTSLDADSSFGLE